jgi:hypothetical protein
MKWISSFVLIFAVTFSAHANGYFSVQKVSKGRDFSFPILKNRTQVGTKINQFLQLSELGSLAGPQSRRLFDRVSIDDSTIYGGKVEIKFKTHINNEKLISFGFTNASCGATCAYWVTYHTFNSQNGDRIALRDLFTESGYKRFSKLVSKERTRKFRSEVKRHVEADKREMVLAAVGSIEADELEDFAIGNGSILIDGENCLSKNDKFYGIDMKMRFALRSFKSHLNDFGRIVFGLKKGTIGRHRSDSLPQLFAGKVNGRSPFVAVLLNQDHGEVTGIYAYLKYRKGIFLTGKSDNGRVELRERILVAKPLNPHTNSTHRWIDGGKLTGTFDRWRFEGTWSDGSNVETLPFIAVGH